MTPDRWQQIERLLDQALDLDSDERSTFLDQACADDPDLRREVETLLAAEAAAPAFLDEDAAAFAAPAMDRLPVPSVAGQHIGPYRLLRELGRGGMGVVYLAEHEDVGKHVALKLVRGGPVDPVATRRFLLERRVLARLEHPHIARLYDAGMAEPTPGQPGEGTPYFVMEYVEGRPIDAYCDAKQLGVEDRLRLFETVGRAVQHAHQHFVVHRDLKPSNILVTEDGRVKLLDFGIAKVLAEAEEGEGEETLTGTGRRVLTPAYAAPEQVRGEAVTAATDVYALGVVLYELLTGSRPVDISGKGLEAAQAVLTQEPKRPSTAVTTSEDTATLAQARNTTTERLSRRLRGDLDMMCLKALQKDPSRRYASAEAFVEDIRRHLAGLPVVARPDTGSYRLKKFVQRHRLGVVMAAALSVLIVGFAIAMALQQAATGRERDRARLEAQKAQEVTTFMLGLFEANDPSEALGDTITARTLLERGVERAEALEKQPDVQAQMLEAMGRVYQSLGRYDRAEPLLRKALTLRQTYLGTEYGTVAGSFNSLAELLLAQGSYAEAESLFYQALTLQRAAHGEQDSTVAVVMNNLAVLLERKGNYPAAESLHREVLTMRRALLGDVHPDVSASQHNLAVVLFRRGHYAQAESLYYQVLTTQRRLWGDVHPSVANTMNDLASTLEAKADFPAAESLYRQTLSLQRRLLGREHPQVAVAMSNLANLLAPQHKYAEAETLHQGALAMRRKLLGETNPEVGESLYSLAFLMTLRADYATAEQHYREVLDLWRPVLGEDHPNVALVMNEIARLHARQGRHREAAALDRDVLDRHRTIYGEEHPYVALSLGNLASDLYHMGAYAEAERYSRETLAMRRTLFGEEHPYIADALNGLGRVLYQQERYRESEPLLRQSLAMRRKLHGEQHPRVAYSLYDLAEVCRRTDRVAEAEPLLQEAFTLRRDGLGNDHPDTKQSIQHLIDFYEAWGRPDNAASYRALLDE